MREGKEEQVKLLEELSHMREALDTSKEEQQMLQVTLQGKNTHLLETQDKLL